MPKICDHTSVGMFVWRGGKLLLIERAKFPFGFAVPAGHLVYCRANKRFGRAQSKLEPIMEEWFKELNII